jgi:hypothetical protein
LITVLEYIFRISAPSLRQNLMMLADCTKLIKSFMLPCMIKQLALTELSSDETKIMVSYSFLVF